jgi:hypothetical protein
VDAYRASNRQVRGVLYVQDAFNLINVLGGCSSPHDAVQNNNKYHCPGSSAGLGFDLFSNKTSRLSIKLCMQWREGLCLPVHYTLLSSVNWDLGILTYVHTETAMFATCLPVFLWFSFSPDVHLLVHIHPICADGVPALLHRPRGLIRKALLGVACA